VIEPLSVLIVDDHALYRRSLRALLMTADDVEVIGEAADGVAALAMSLDSQPDVVLMDLQMPRGDGIEATRRIAEAAPHIAILVLTMFEDPSSVRAAIQAGARGYALKGSSRADLLRALRGVAAGDTTFTGAAGSHLAALVAPPSSPSQAFPSLSERELAILQLVAAGQSNHSIARQLGISDKTVRNNLSRLLAKIGAADRSGAAALAIARGLGPAQPPAWAHPQDGK
jgi:DNA-binding NarL/FixJ family response regulator